MMDSEHTNSIDNSSKSEAPNVDDDNTSFSHSFIDENIYKGLELENMEAQNEERRPPTAQSNNEESEGGISFDSQKLVVGTSHGSDICIDMGMVRGKAKPTFGRSNPSIRQDKTSTRALGGDDLYTSNIDTAHDYDDNKYNGSDIIDNGSDILDMELVCDNSPLSQKSIHNNFLLFSFLFALNHGGVVSCTSLIAARLGDSLNVYQTYAFYGSYTLSALMGVDSIVKVLGKDGKSAVSLGMWINCVYIGCFALAVAIAGDDGDTDSRGGIGLNVVVSICGLLGGLGGGLLWTAQGSYFAQVSAKFTDASDTNKHRMPETTLEKASKELGGQFAAIYLTVELIMRILSTVAISTLDWSWVIVILGYTSIAVISALFMSITVMHYGNKEVKKSPNVSIVSSVVQDGTSMLRLFWTNRKIKHIIPFCILFPLTSSFITSFVNEEALLLVFEENDSIYVKLFSFVSITTAAVVSVPFARLAQRTGNGVILVVGCVAFALTSLLFIIMPELEGWGVVSLLAVYGLQGIGRAVFEGNLRAEFAVMFAHEKESAFANIVFWGGLFSTIGFSFTTYLGCLKVSTYCIKYHDGSLHEVLIYELLVLTSAILAIVGLLRLSTILKRESKTANRLSKILQYLGD